MAGVNGAKAVWYCEPSENSDKIHISIYSQKDGIVTAYWGKRGASLQSKGKFGSMSDFRKLYESKMDKGYKAITDVTMIAGLVRQLPAEHADILSQEYGVSSTVTPSTMKPAPKPAVAPKAVSVPNEISISKLDAGEKAVVVCKANPGTDFEIGVEYLCVEWDGLTMVVQNMNGEEVYVLPSQFAFKGKV